MKKTINHWHVPTNVIRFQKNLLEKRKIEVPLHLEIWKEKILNINDLTKEEENELKEILLSIDLIETEFTLKRLVELTQYVSQRYLGNLVLLKYMPNVVYEDLWNGFYLNARGCVIDLESCELVSATLGKFFNVGEKEETSIEMIREKIEKFPYITYVKQDGSCVSVSFHHDLVITTPGSFESMQTTWAKHFLERKKEKFLKDLKEKYKDMTFIFEYVGPENRVVVEYKETNMILLHIIHKKTGKIFSYDKVKEFAKEYDFDVCEVTKENIETLFIEKDNKEKYKANEIEGWVLRIEEEEQVFFAKLKCQDYTEMHGIISNAISPKWILESMIDETIDDKLAAIESEEIKKIVLKVMETISRWNEEKKEKLKEYYRSIDENRWLDEKLIKSYQMFHEMIIEKTKEFEKGEKVRTFLIDFSKGKTKNPKEEINLKALLLTEKYKEKFNALREYDQYKAFISNRIKEAKLELEQAIDAYVFHHMKKEKWEKYLTDFETYEHVKEFHETYQDVVKQMEKETYYRYKSIGIEKLKKEKRPLKMYIEEMEKLKLQKRKVLKEFEENLLRYLFRKIDNEEFKHYMSEEYRIDEKVKKFVDFKEKFEEKILHRELKDEKQENKYAILKQFYAILRGLETDNSYDIARNIFEEMDETYKDQKEYHKQKGILSGYLKKNIPSFYRGIILSCMDSEKEKRDEKIKEASFLDGANIVTMEKEKLEESEIDLRFIHEINSPFSVDELE